MIKFGNEMYDVESHWYYAQDIKEGDMIFYQMPYTAFPHAYLVVDKHESYDEFSKRTKEALILRAVTDTRSVPHTEIMVVDRDEQLLVLLISKVIK